MTASVTRLRPREFYAVVPGLGPEPVFYARTFDGLLSAIVHARLLSAGGGNQDITLTEGRRTRVIRRLEDGTDVTGKLLPPPYETAFRPAAGDIRPGAPRGHIPEICTAAKNRGRRTRRNPNMPRPSWPGLKLT